MKKFTEWRKKWSHAPTAISADATGLWYSEECVDQMLEDFRRDNPPESRIRTSYVFPPIPDRSHDWQAWIDGDEESGPYGHGRTEQEAIEDLHAQQAANDPENFVGMDPMNYKG